MRKTRYATTVEDWKDFVLRAAEVPTRNSKVMRSRERDADGRPVPLKVGWYLEPLGTLAFVLPDGRVQRVGLAWRDMPNGGRRAYFDLGERLVSRLYLADVDGRYRLVPRRSLGLPYRVWTVGRKKRLTARRAEIDREVTTTLVRPARLARLRRRLARIDEALAAP
jgi:hypothetical protein